MSKIVGIEEKLLQVEVTEREEVAERFKEIALSVDAVHDEHVV